MKITYTREELKVLVANKLGLGVEDFTLSISDGKNLFTKIPTLIERLVEKMQTAGVFEGGSYYKIIRDDRKIQAIKTFRDFYNDNGFFSPGLRESKDIIENWTKFYNYCLTTGKFPVDDTIYVWR